MLHIVGDCHCEHAAAVSNFQKVGADPANSSATVSIFKLVNSESEVFLRTQLDNGVHRFSHSLFTVLQRRSVTFNIRSGTLEIALASFLCSQ